MLADAAPAAPAAGAKKDVKVELVIPAEERQELELLGSNQRRDIAQQQAAETEEALRRIGADPQEEGGGSQSAEAATAPPYVEDFSEYPEP